MVSEIVKNRLYVGNAHDGMGADELNIDFDQVITIGAMKSDNTTQQFSMPDGGYPFEHETHFGVFSDAVEAVVEALESDETVLVHCNAGQSRSPAVIIAVLTVMDGYTFEQAFDEVSSKHRATTLSPELRWCAEKYAQTVA